MKSTTKKKIYGGLALAWQLDASAKDNAKFCAKIIKFKILSTLHEILYEQSVGQAFISSDKIRRVYANGFKLFLFLFPVGLSQRRNNTVSGDLTEYSGE